MFTDRAASKLLQSDFPARVGAKYGLERGIERSKAHHNPIQKVYPQVMQAIEQAEAKNRLIEVRTGELLARREQISGDAAARTFPRPVRITAENVTPRVVSKNILGIATHETAEQVAGARHRGAGALLCPAARGRAAPAIGGDPGQQLAQVEQSKRQS